MSGRVIGGEMHAGGDAPLPHTYTVGVGGTKRPNSNKSTPLHRFTEAKSRIKEVYREVNDYVKELADVLAEVESRSTLIGKEEVSAVTRVHGSVATISDMLERDHMKVVFFGRTSNGKSTCINAMLHTKALPQGIGHTTACFVQVQGTKSNDKYMMTGTSETPKSIESLDSVAHAMNEERANMGDDTLVTVFWPETESTLLKNDVVLVDTPGVDVSPEFDHWIDKHCLDADVFVFVANAESTLSESERKFFMRVKEKVSKPNIFVLNNRWDASAMEPETMEMVRKQHNDQFRRLLCDELNVCAVEHLPNRLFFVSAREVLAQRLKVKGISTPSSFIVDGHQERAFEFNQFEEHFEECISKAAIMSKFAMHAGRAREITERLLEHIKALLETGAVKMAETTSSMQAGQSRLATSVNGLKAVVDQSHRHIALLSQEVQIKVADDFNDEIRRLDAIIDAFDRPFDESGAYVKSYKKELIAYIDEVITKRLTDRCTGGLHSRIFAVQKNMIGGFGMLFPKEYGDKAQAALQFRDAFVLNINVNCTQLAEDFQEDLTFRFSLGISNIIRRGTMFMRQQQAVKGSPSESADDMTTIIDEDVVLRSLVVSSAAYAANGSLGVALLGGLIYRTIGARPIVICGAVYGGLYLWERMRWNSHAKERLLKQQLRQHLQLKLRYLQHTTTAHCDTQVKREVGEVLSRLRATAGQVHGCMKTEVETLQAEQANVKSLCDTLNMYKGKAVFLNSEIDSFEAAYL